MTTLLPTTDKRRRYRFEPVWIHRLLLETEPTMVKVAAVEFPAAR